MAEIHETVAGARSGDAEAFATLFGRALPRLKAFIRLRAGGVVTARESVSDLAQSVCREVLQDLDDFEYRGEAAFRSFLLQRAIHKIRKRQRFYLQGKRDISREASPEQGGDVAEYAQHASKLATPSQHASASELLQRIELGLDRLPEDQRDAVVMSRIVGLSYAEIAEQLGRTESAVRGLVARALARLAALCDEREP